MKYRSRNFYSKRPKTRVLTGAQAEKAREAFAAAPATIEGRYARGQLVADGENVYKVISIGIRYHEDVSNCLYGVAPARAPKEWKATNLLRQTIEKILKWDGIGTHDPQSRGVRDDKPSAAMPTGLQLVAKWEDGQPDSLASFPYLQVFAGGFVLAIRPNYDDSPSVAWVKDERLAAQLVKAIEVSPKPYYIQSARVRQRTPKAPDEKNQSEPQQS